MTSTAEGLPVLDLVRTLLGGGAATRVYLTDPSSAFAQAGLSHLSLEDVYDVVTLVEDTRTVDYASARVDDTEPNLPGMPLGDGGATGAADFLAEYLTGAAGHPGYGVPEDAEWPEDDVFSDVRGPTSNDEGDHDGWGDADFGAGDPSSVEVAWTDPAEIPEGGHGLDLEARSDGFSEIDSARSDVDPDVDSAGSDVDFGAGSFASQAPDPHTGPDDVDGSAVA
jgi:hypothetical protein